MDSSIAPTHGVIPTHAPAREPDGARFVSPGDGTVRVFGTPLRRTATHFRSCYRFSRFARIGPLRVGQKHHRTRHGRNREHGRMGDHDGHDEGSGHGAKGGGSTTKPDTSSHGVRRISGPRSRRQVVLPRRNPCWLLVGRGLRPVCWGARSVRTWSAPVHVGVGSGRGSQRRPSCDPFNHRVAPGDRIG